VGSEKILSFPAVAQLILFLFEVSLCLKGFNLRFLVGHRVFEGLELCLEWLCGFSDGLCDVLKLIVLLRGGPMNKIVLQYIW